MIKFNIKEIETNEIIKFEQIQTINYDEKNIEFIKDGLLNYIGFDKIEWILIK